MPDMGLPSEKRLAEVLNAVADSAAAGRRAAVRCRGGIGRTGTVVGCHYVQHHGLSGEEALACIAGEWATVEKLKYYPSSPLTEAQRRFVQDYWQIPR